MALHCLASALLEQCPRQECRRARWRGWQWRSRCAGEYLWHLEKRFRAKYFLILRIISAVLARGGQEAGAAGAHPPGPSWCYGAEP